MQSVAYPSQPPLALTMGCPAGIGPEILCRFLLGSSSHKNQCVIIGDQHILRQAAALLNANIAFVSWIPGQKPEEGTVSVFDVPVAGVDEADWGHPNGATGKASGRYIEEAVGLISQGHCSGLVTCPISKKGLQQGGYSFPGHTEMLAALSGTAHVRMMMAGSRLKVVLVTIHEPFTRVGTLLTRKEIVACIRMTGEALCRDFAIARPKIAVAALNPHAGENGLFGDEEGRLITPAVKDLTGEYDVTGPWPPDTVFYQATQGQYDAVVAMYHDQGLIPFKLIHFADGVNVTLGLPFVRTSVDHGTAYDIAGKNLASASSLESAVILAGTIVENRMRAL